MATETPIPGELLNRIAAYARLHLLDTVPSTNDYALNLAGSREPAVVVARQQTRGRGRFRRRWFADEDSLIFSLLIFPAPGAAQASGLTQISGLALCRAIEELTGLKPQIRWPNDIMLQNRKLAGILCEGRRDAVAIGVGVNVNQQSFPDSVPEAGSIRLATGRAWDRIELLERFLADLFRSLDQLRTSGFTGLLDAIKQRSLVINRRVEVRTALRRRVGTVLDLDAEGRIVLRTDSGRLEVLNAGQVRHLR